jgi:hypothetical protein
MTRARSQFTDAISLHATGDHRAIWPGDIVDLDEVLVSGLTLRDALGAHVDGFVLMPAPSKAKAKSHDDPAPPAAPKE